MSVASLSLRSIALFLAFDLFCMAANDACGQPAGDSRAGTSSKTAPENPEEKGTYIGILFSRVSEPLYDHLPQLPRNQGVMVTHVLPDSPASSAGIRRHDILLQYQKEKIRDCDHLVQLIQADKPGNITRLTFLRGGKITEANLTLRVGPVLRIAAISPAIQTPGVSGATIAVDAPDTRPGIAKPGGGSARLSVSAQPLQPGQMKLSIEFYQEGTGRLKTVVCEGGDEEIDREVKKLPEKEQTLVNEALRRLRQLNLKQEPPKQEK